MFKRFVKPVLVSMFYELADELLGWLVEAIQFLLTRFMPSERKQRALLTLAQELAQDTSSPVDDQVVALLVQQLHRPPPADGG